MHAHTNKRKAGAAILISDKVDSREKNIAKDKEGPFITLNVSLIGGHDNSGKG